jgi:putative tryptophan/tyrosine transport system substrate-binding protein
MIFLLLWQLPATPLEQALIASLARPGGNVTGVSSAAAEVAGKGLQIIREIVPSASRVAVLANPADPFTKSFLQQISVAAGTLGIGLQTILVRSAADIDPAFTQMSAAGAQAIIVQPSLLQKRIVELALHYRLVTISISRQLPEAGGLVSYAGNSTQMDQESAVYVDKILKGAKPADLPVQEPTRFELVINLKTAKSLGLTIPQSILLRADEVIE